MSAANPSVSLQSDKKAKRDATAIPTTADPRRATETTTVTTPEEVPAEETAPIVDEQAEKKQKKEKKKEKKEKKKRDADAADATVADPVEGEAADGEETAAGADKAKKDRKREKKERKERERLEREQAEKDAATVAAASAYQASLSALASAPKLPMPDIDPLLAGGQQAADAANGDKAAPTTEAVAAAVEAEAADAEPAVPEKKPKGKRGRTTKAAVPKADGEDGDAADGEAPPKKKARGGRVKTDKTENFEALRKLTPRELLVERVYSSDTLKKLEREIGLKYKKGRFTSEEENILKEGIKEFKFRKGLSDDDFQELLYNYKAKNQERDFTELWKELTGRLEDRANISVRLHIKTRYSQYRNKGKYTLAEDHEIRYRLGELKEDIGSVAKRLGRLGQDISSRWVKLQVRDEMNNGPAFTPEEDDAVMEALEKHKREHPDELVSWKDIAKELGNKRSYKVYSACTHSIASRVRKRKAQKDSQDPSHSQSMQRGSRSIKRDAGPGDGWIPGDDDLCLLQRLEYQYVTNESQINWKEVSFYEWQWPVELLKTKYEEIKTKNLPETWNGNLAQTLDKLIKVYRAKEVKSRKSDDDEGMDARNIDRTVLAEMGAAALGDQPPPGLDPALRSEGQGLEAISAAAAAALAAAATSSAQAANNTVPQDQQQVDDMLS